MKNKSIAIGSAIAYIILLIISFLWLDNLGQTWGQISDFIQSTTFIVSVSIAIWIYLAGKADHKESIARSIMQEIRAAEESIDTIRGADTGQTIIPNEINILTSDSWKNNSHLFSKDLTTDDLDKIEKFYTRCRFLDRTGKKIIEDLFTFYNDVSKKHIKDTCESYNKEYESAENKKIFLEEPIKKPTEHDIQNMQIQQSLAQKISQENRTFKHFYTTLNTIKFISETRAVDKIRKIAKFK